MTHALPSSPPPGPQPLAAQLEAMNEEERAGWQLPEKALRAFHYRAVQRIYGEQGAQVGPGCRAAGMPSRLQACKLKVAALAAVQPRPVLHGGRTSQPSRRVAAR